MGVTQLKIKEEYLDVQYNLDQRLKQGKGYQIGDPRNMLQISAGLFWFCLHVPQHFNTQSNCQEHANIWLETSRLFRHLGGGVKKGISNNFSSLKRHTFSTNTKGGAAEHYYVIGVH
jgi:hypothetical protein